jgi:hypothetical protein
VWRGADAVSLGVTTAGFALAGLAARRIGWQRTYFAEELGLLPPIRIRAFPYGVVPHPMILGALVGLIGIALYAPFRAAWPWLVPVHVALYGVVLAQEIVSRDSFVTRMASRAGG